MAPSTPDEQLLAGQLDYYQQRAPEYDDWFFRRGRYDRGPDANREWFAEIDDVRDTLGRTEWTGRSVLELASGTGLWTTWLLDHGAHVHAVDGSAAMLGQLRATVGSRDVPITTEQADLFTWFPTSTYDAVFFGFWLSHVPRARLATFFAMVASALRPGGVVGFVDSRRDPASTAVDHVLPDEGEQLTRRLNDGREFRIVKNFLAPTELREVAAAADVDLRVTTTARYFLVGLGTRN